MTTDTNKIKLAKSDPTKPSVSEYINSITHLTQPELREIACAIFAKMESDSLVQTSKDLRQMFRVNATKQAIVLSGNFKAGDRVRITKSNGKGSNLGDGTVVKVNRTKVQVRFDSQPLGLWNVPFSLLSKI